MMYRNSGATCSTVNSCNRNSGNEDFSVNVFSVSPHRLTRPGAEVSDGDKTGATLLFSGVCLGLVGITFTVMGWLNYDINKSLEWTQLLGPILLSVGVTFVLIAVCKFDMVTCKVCKRHDDGSPEGEPAQPSQSFVFTGINQPITFHGATVVQYIPPPYAPETHDRGAADIIQPRGILPGVSRTTCPPQYCSIYPRDNPSFTDVDHSQPSRGLDNSNCRNHENEERPDGKTTNNETTDSSAPPAYDDIFNNGST